MAYRLDEIAARFELELAGDGKVEIGGLCGLSDDLPRCLSFLSAARYLNDAAQSRIAAFVTTPEHIVDGKPCLLHEHPEYAIALIANLFVPSQLEQDEQIHPSAIIGAGSEIGSGVEIGPYAVIGRGCVVGSGTRVLAHAVIMDRVQIGRDCILYPHSVVREDCVLGDRAILQAGAVIGGDGYGFVEHQGAHVKIPQLGNTVLEADVEIGSNSTIDRGRFTDTRIGRGTKVDNLVMVAHNVKTGEGCLLVSQTGISGSSNLGDRVTLAGQVGLVGHVNIADDVTVMGQSMVTKDIRESGAWAGSPARPVKLWKKALARLYAGLR